MEAQHDPVGAALDAFRASLVDDVYAPRDFVPWSDIEQFLNDHSAGLVLLNSLARVGCLSKDDLAHALIAEPQVLVLVQRLFAAPTGGVGFVDGRRLLDEPPRTLHAASHLADLLIELGLPRLLTNTVTSEELLRVALIGADTRRRSGRRRRSMDSRIDALLKDVLRDVGNTLDGRLTSGDLAGVPSRLGGRLHDVVCLDGVPVAAVATVFESVGGGRQNITFRDFARIQDELDEVPVALVLIADGAGVRGLPRTTFEQVWKRVGAVMSLAQAEHGALADTVRALARSAGTPRAARLPIDRYISAVLAESSSVTVDDLPVGEEAGRLALARFENDHPELDLLLDARFGRLSFARAEAVDEIEGLRRVFDPTGSVQAVAALLSRRPSGTVEELEAEVVLAVVDAPPTPLVPGRLAVVSVADAPTAQRVREVAAAARERVLDSTVAVLVVPDAGGWMEDPDRDLVMRTTTTSVVVVDPDDLRDLATSADAMSRLSALILRQADLTKTSPFVHNGVTPARLFAGRRADEAAIVSILASSSVAVLGSRRIGKTSLMRRVEQALRAQGRTVYYGDCQPVGEWKGFAKMARRQWGVKLSSEFDSDQVAQLAEGLTVADDPPVVILDEIDRLVAWDIETSTGGVHEAFFRALRALSQTNRAQFMFSGERTIAEQLWSPTSPHWNFCQRVILRQLDRPAAAGLLFDVLASLSVRFEDPDAAEHLLWEATSGHPRLVQLLGDELVHRLNERPGDQRAILGLDDLEALIEAFDYRREYVETYWGQARPLEQELSRLVADGERSLGRLQDLAAERDEPHALRILELYGIMDVEGDEVRLRAEYLPVALRSVGSQMAAT